MYVRPSSDRYHNSVRIPQNYSGNAFREPPIKASPQGKEEVVNSEEETQAKSEPEIIQSEMTSQQPEPQASSIRLTSLFGKFREIGTEEILIFALILLLADSDDDLLFFLILLFFIK